MLPYTETKFTEPETLTEEQYLGIKTKTFSDPNFTIIDYKIDYYERFKKEIWVIAISLSVILICIAIDFFLNTKSDIIEIIEMIAGIFFILPLLSFIKSGSSYASAMERRNDLFSWMHFCVFSSSSLTEYYMFFYENQSTEANRELRKRYNKWRKGN